MTTLSQAACEACRTGSKPLSLNECDALLLQTPGWLIERTGGIPQLSKIYLFKDFSQALAFTNEVAAIAEDQQHHPALLTEWGKVTVKWWTHAVSGLHRNDFIMAARTDELASQTDGLKHA